MKAPLMGLFETIPFFFPGVNAWAAQESFKLRCYQAASRIDLRSFRLVTAYFCSGVRIFGPKPQCLRCS